MTLETCSLNWADMYALFVASPPYTALHHAFNEKWTLTDHILVTALDRLNTLLWTKTKDAHKKPPRNQPKRIPRPGVDEKGKSQDPVVQNSVMDLSQFLKMQAASGRNSRMYHREESA
jgi:hypothetical protein